MRRRRVSLGRPTRVANVALKQDHVIYFLYACKEAIHNAIKHSAATQLQLRLAIEEEFLLEIRDDGMGLPLISMNPGR